MRWNFVKTRSKLNLLKQHILRESDVNIMEIDAALKDKEVVGIPYLDVWNEANTTPYFLDDDYCLVREVRYPLDHQHGRYQFREFLTAMEMWNKECIQHPLSAHGFRPRDLFFFDTETTGLGGGAGNTIFILGYASFKDNEVILRQHFLPEPGLEVPLYHSFLENIDYTTLVTYNGKAFDWPQVKTRHTLIRNHVPKLPMFGHFDLYHASRRLWKNQLESVKLVNVEKEILHFERKDDIPGFLAPMIYFDYVERKDPEAIINVLKHNENDILSLITLYTHLSFQIQQEDPLQTNSEKVLVGKWFNYIGAKEAAIKTFTGAAENDDLAAKHELAYFFKKEKKYDEAKDLWLEVVENGEKTIKKQACIEIAMLLEHQFKNYQLAYEYTIKAIALHETKSKASDKFLQNAEKRLKRLERKY